MSNPEQEQQIIAQMELLEFELPAIKHDASTALSMSVICLPVGAGLFWAGQAIGESNDSFGKAPEIAGAVLASWPLAIGVLAVAAAGLESWQYHQLKKQNNLLT